MTSSCEDYMLVFNTLILAGLTADVVAVRGWRSIHVAGKAYQRLILPAATEEWIPFLTYQANILKNLLELYDETATEVTDKLAAEKYLKLADEGLGSETVDEDSEDAGSEDKDWFAGGDLEEEEDLFVADLGLLELDQYQSNE
ncbi:hypothetical protein BGZ58_002124 [Dissophora ornata]|nr:hypothetical protein BGZ58_002124 [Dissophora ornata]